MTNRWAQLNTVLLLTISAQLAEGWYRTVGLGLAAIVGVVIIGLMIHEEVQATRVHKV